MNVAKNKEKMTEMMFENFQCKGLYIAIPAVLSLYANGRTTGLVCDSGHSVSHTVPVFDGFQLPYAANKNLIAGKSITENLLNLLAKDNIILDGLPEQTKICT